MSRRTERLFKVIGYRFDQPAWLEQALTHGSQAGAAENYQRLEFLGDRILGLVIAEELFQRYQDKPEGKLALQFNALVRKETCADVPLQIGLDQHVRTHPTLPAETLRNNRVMGDVCEAVIAALYLDGGLDAARAFVLEHWAERFKDTAKTKRDAKSRLQEWALSKALPIPDYVETDRRGPDHAPVFDVEVTVEGFESVTGTARSKRAAEQDAAAAFLKKNGLAA